MVKILVVDDDADDRLLFKDALEETHLICELKSATDGEDMLQQLGETSDSDLPDLIFLDLNMPRLDGRGALEKLKSDKRLRTIPVVILTTSNAEEDVIESYNTGASSYISKPVTFDGLCAKISSLTEYWFGVVKLPARE